MQPLLLLALLALASASAFITHHSHVPRQQQQQQQQQRRQQCVHMATRVVSRRRAAAGLLSSTFFAASGSGRLALNHPSPAAAFENGLAEDMAKFKDKPKFPGTAPATLGLRGSTGKLATCDDAPNCFSTSGDAAHLLQPWEPNKPAADAMAELLETIKAYPPGQSKIDKGGFSIIAARPDYLYAQFESLKHGFIDDLEFFVPPEGAVQVRSSSRVGFLDLQVNAKRLNWISNDLRAKGWTAEAITEADYPDYFGILFFTNDDYIRSVLSPEDCPVPTEPLKCKDPSSR
jgi:uncharacterized protein (DUF1499 family)